jgi:phosphatidylserine decarboxylase
LFILSQYLLPHHLLSRLAGCIAECRVRWFKNAFTAWFAKRYQVDMSQALVEDLTAYEHFNAFFTRALKDGARPLDQTPARPQPGRRRGQPARPDRAWPRVPGQGPQLQRAGTAGR